MPSKSQLFHGLEHLTILIKWLIDLFLTDITKNIHNSELTRNLNRLMPIINKCTSGQFILAELKFVNFVPEQF